MIITAEEPRHAAAIESLLDAVFGPDRHAKTSYRLRENVQPAHDLCMVAIDHDENGREVVEGAIRYWPVLLAGAAPALLLGPIAVSPRLHGRGLGSKMIRMTLNKAAASGHRAILLVGDAPYYARFGFDRRATLGLSLPGPVDPARFLGLELVAGALMGLHGAVTRWPAEGLAAAWASTAAAPAAPSGAHIWYAHARHEGRA